MVEGEFHDDGCDLWRTAGNPPNCKPCPLVGMFCIDCPDYDICPKAGLPKIKSQSTRWINKYSDYKRLGVKLETQFNRDLQAYRIISDVEAETQQQQIEQMKNGRRE